MYQIFSGHHGHGHGQGQNQHIQLLKNLSKKQLQALLVIAQQQAANDNNADHEFFWGVIIHTIQALIKSK